MSPRPGDAPGRTPSGPLASLDARLAALGLGVELCVIGGAVLPLVFRSDPGTRRPIALFGALETLRAEGAAVAAAHDLEPGWLAREARSVVGAAGARTLELSALRVFAPQPEYVLALRCARLSQAPGEEREELGADIGYLARSLGLGSAAAVLAAVEPYLPESLLTDSLEAELAGLPGVIG